MIGPGLWGVLISDCCSKYKMKARTEKDVSIKKLPLTFWGTFPKNLRSYYKGGKWTLPLQTVFLHILALKYIQTIPTPSKPHSEPSVLPLIINAFIFGSII